MKCPKCGYLGFEPVERCRNCGYDFSLLPAIDLPELSIREQGAREVNPLDDLALIDAAMTAAQLSSSGQSTPDLERVMSGPERRQPAADLLLFGAPGADDEPLITKASPPRPPLAVRRATPEVTRLRTVPVRAPMLDLGTADPGAASRSASQVAAHPGTDEGAVGADGEVAGLFARLTASAIDLMILAAIDLLVVYFTMQICALDLADLKILPKGPLVAFLLVQNLGYLVVFTAGGQTLGKMAADIRVVSARPNSSLDLAHSIVRTLVWIVLAVPAGLGFLTALFSRDRRGLHDRCAGTRVVRASI